MAPGAIGRKRRFGRTGQPSQAVVAVDVGHIGFEIFFGFSSGTQFIFCWGCLDKVVIETLAMCTAWYGRAHRYYTRQYGK